MNRFLIGFVLVVGLMLTGCAKKTERNATESTSTVEVEKDEALPSKIDGVDVEPQKDEENINAVANFEAGIAAYQANDLPLAYEEFLAASRKGHADSQFNLGLMYEQGIGVGKDEKRYADGNPVSSEITLFPGFISDLRETGNKNLLIVQSVYEDLQAAPERAAKIARDALKGIDAENEK